jgi:adenosyl cobinamide kinase/adenosyl cobinamide phosphate guanylyltransferase
MRTLDKCRAALNNTLGEYHFDCPVDNMFFEFTGVTADQFKDFVATGASDEEVAAWVEKHAKRRERIEVIKWNNGLRYKRLSETDDHIQEYMEDYIPQFVPKHLQHHIDYFFDIYDAEEKRMET